MGGGIGGASAALYLRRLFGDDTNIQLYEMERLGGRLALEELDGYRSVASDAGAQGPSSPGIGDVFWLSIGVKRLSSIMLKPNSCGHGCRFHRGGLTY